MKQVLTTYINYSRHLIPDPDHRHEGMREEASSTLIMVSANQGSISNVSGSRGLEFESHPNHVVNICLSC